MSYETELTQKAFKSNVVILLKGKYFTKYAPDSGLPLDSGILAYFPFENDALDRGRVYTMTKAGSPTFAASPTLAGGHFVLKGFSTSNYYSMGAGLNTALSALSNFRMGFRIKLESVAAQCLFSFGSASNTALLINNSASNKVDFMIGGTTYSASYTFATQTEYYLEFGFSSGAAFVYINGVSVLSQAGPFTTPTASARLGVLYSGASNSLPFLGALKDFLIATTFTGSNYSTLAENADGTVIDLKINPVTVDPRNAKTTIRNYEFSLIDKNLMITKMFLDNENAFMGETVRIFLGRITGSFSFADYYELPQTQVTKLSFKREAFNFQTEEAINMMRYPIFNETSPLSVGIDDNDMSIVVDQDIIGFPASGTLKIDSEFITYSAKNDGTKTFTVSARGALSSTAAEHDTGSTVYKVSTITGNPLTIFLQMMITGSYAGSPYDLLEEGMGISPSLIDVTGIETLRDESFIGDEFSFKLYGIEEFLTWAEEEILLPCNCRIVMNADGKISLSILDKNAFQEYTQTFDEDTIVPGSVNYAVSDKKIINIVEIHYDYNHVTDKYESSLIDFSERSIEIYGDRKVYKLEFKGIQTSLDGATFVQSLATRILNRFSTATPEISLQTQFDKSLTFPGEIVLLDYNLPAPTGARDFIYDLEVLQSGIDEKKGLVNFSLGFTAYTGLKFAFISASDMIVTAPAQNQITVASGRGAMYKAGWKMRLYLPASGQTADAVNEIASISGDTINFVDNFSTSLTTSYGVRFANYDEVTEEQKRYGFISEGTANFPDGKSPYLVSF